MDPHWRFRRMLLIAGDDAYRCDLLTDMAAPIASMNRKVSSIASVSLANSVHPWALSCNPDWLAWTLTSSARALGMTPCVLMRRIQGRKRSANMGIDNAHPCAKAQYLRCGAPTPSPSLLR